MRAVILVKARPGFDVISSTALRDLASRAENVTVNDIFYCFGRFDGVITCTSDSMKNIAQFAELIRREGNFLTETLLALD